MSIVTIKEKLSLITGVFGEGNITKDGMNVSVYCPSCMKSPKMAKKRKLSICLSTGMYHCWVCERVKGRNIAYLVKRLGHNQDRLDKFYRAFGSIDYKIDDEVKILELPTDFKLLCLAGGISARLARKYLFSRGLTEDDIIRYKIGLSKEFYNMVVFPSFDDELELNYFIARSFVEGSFRKYKNCDADRKDVIFNESTIDWSREVILVEGVFDAIKAGDNAVSMLGSWIDESYHLFKKIVSNRTPVVLALDPDAIGKARKIADKLTKYCVDVRVSQHTQCDFGDMTKEKAKFYVNSAKRFDVASRMRYLICDIKSGSIY